MFALAYRGDSI